MTNSSSRIRLTDCTAFTDGASAIVLATEAGLQTLVPQADGLHEILSYGHSVAALGQEICPIIWTQKGL